MWGILPAYWNLLAGVNPLLILCCRIIFSFVFTIGILIISKRMQILKEIIKNKSAMLHLTASAVLITCNWGLYIWAVNAGRILDSSLGYYMNPLMVFVLGVIVFREKYTRLQLAAVALAVVGVLISVFAYGSFPYISIGLALSFGLYGLVKKKARTDPVASIAIENLIITPFALAFSLIFMMDSVVAVSISEMLLLIGGGVVTAIPLVLYSRSVNNIPFLTIGFLQYISPSLALVYGMMRGEMPSVAQTVSFVFIGLGLVVFSAALVGISKVETVK